MSAKPKPCGGYDPSPHPGNLAVPRNFPFGTGGCDAGRNRLSRIHVLRQRSHDLSARHARQTLHTWTASGSAQTCAYRLPNGSAWFPIQNTSCISPARNSAYPSGRFPKISWTNTILWDNKFCGSTAGAGCDVALVPKGNMLFPENASVTAPQIFTMAIQNNAPAIVVLGWTDGMIRLFISGDGGADYSI